MGLEYLSIALASLCLAFLATPAIRWLAFRLNLMDMPDRTLKTHDTPTPRLGGIAIFFAITCIMVATRLVTNYPTGTIRSFRYILLGSVMMFIVGLADDLRQGGINYKWKFALQFLAASVILIAPVRIQFVTPHFVATMLTLFWVVGVANAVNLIDILDGLAATQAAIAAAAFLAISFPSEDIYVNILASAVLGASLGFLPHNFRKGNKIFMGDAGSLTLGYLLAVLALGSSYSGLNDFGVYAPILILGVPVFETIFLIYIRLKQGLSPFMGSRDHIAHRLQSLGFSDNQILLIMGGFAAMLSLIAFWIARAENESTALSLYAVLMVCLFAITRGLSKINSNLKRDEKQK